MNQEVIMAGFGGQGIMVMGKLLAMAGMLDNREVTWFPSYGAEMRGGTANCTVIIADQAIGSPIVARPWACIAMNQPSMERFAPRVKPGGFLLANSSLITCNSLREDIEVLAIPITDQADRLGSIKVANIIALSAFCTRTGIVSPDSLERVMEESFAGKGDSALMEINRAAIRAGREMALCIP
ncbi:MAG: 2-oxoacid:acceptor oxidoreductase family protein [bacterium]